MNEHLSGMASVEQRLIDWGPAITAAATGDERAFAAIVDSHQADMERVCFVICGDIELAQEGVQLAWPIAWRRLGTLRDASSLRPWLVTVAANETRRLARRRRRRAVVEIAVPVESIHEEGGLDPADHLSNLDLAWALERLDEVDRSIVAMRYLADMTSAEIGLAVGLSAAGVRTRLARALPRLRTELER
jgi:RNA polymerase sigma factor (sigma-70 family)